MFTRVLVANRGEIAVRVIRALHELGIEAVAVYSTADEDALHVRLADRAVRIGPPPAAQSYLSMPAIIAAATTTGCEAVHPGYGFLSENAEFVRACEDNDLVFIGPPADVMARMGDKARAKAEMRAAGVPLVPGHRGRGDARRGARRGGRARLSRAAEGGGGRRRARHAARRRRRTRSTTRTRAPSAEAEAAFSDGTLYVEKAITPARHVEIQVICDDHGNVLTCGERECSIQRRHQKLIEESPSPALDARAARGDGVGGGARVRAHRLSERRHVRVPRRSRRRVLVHRAERAAAGRASGDRARDAAGPRARCRSRSPRASALGADRPRAALRPRDRDAHQRGGPARDFRPSPGTLARFRPPLGPGVRVDTFVEEGTVIPPYYDSLIAKVIVRDNDRALAIARARRALGELEIQGVPTTRERRARDPRQRRVPERRVLDLVPRRGRREAAGTGGRMRSRRGAGREGDGRGVTQIVVRPPRRSAERACAGRRQLDVEIDERARACRARARRAVRAGCCRTWRATCRSASPPRSAPCAV